MLKKPSPKTFEYTSCKSDFENKKIRFNYKIEFANREPLFFTEEILLPTTPDLKKIPKELLKNILQSLHLILGISYYKTYCPPQIKMKYELTKEQANFWNTVYRKGLGEFCYRNNINPAKLAKFPYEKKLPPLRRGEMPEGQRGVDISTQKNRSLIGIGGGKDSIAAVEILKKQKKNITGFVVETQREFGLVNNVVEKMQIPQLKIRRKLDEKLFQKLPDSLNGHIPISAIIAFLGVFSAVLYDFSNIIVANEHSSNFGNLKYKGEIINHQWSKSEEFEKLFQDYTANFITPDIKYFSILRMFSELRIAKLFSQYKNYFSIFSSCNKNFRVNANAINCVLKHEQKTLWCGKCPKCVFTFLILSAFLPKQELLDIFKKNLFEDRNLLPTFQDILGFGKMKPFDCVGTFEEAQAALILSGKSFTNSLIIKTYLPLIKNKEQIVKNSFKANSAPNIPDYLLFLGLDNVLILGYGKEGIVTKQYLKKKFLDLKIEIADQKDGPDYLKKQNDFDLAVKTPGLPKELVAIPYTTATNIFFSQIKNTLIGITGTKGKSTTASLIYEILKSAGKNVRLIGNIGNPMLNVLSEKNNTDEIFVIELSSYQLDDLKYSPDIAVVLNLFPDHMTYHGSAQTYYKAKKNIINFQTKENFFIFNPNDNKLAKWAKETNSKAIPFAQKIPVKNAEIPLTGDHNRENIKAAIAVAKTFKISDDIIRRAIKSFKPMPHRLEFVGKFHGVKFYDDANAAIPQSAIAAIKSLPKIGTILLGGEDRGYAFSNLEKTIRKYKIKNIVLFPDSGAKIFKSRKNLNILETNNMEAAIKFAYQDTEKGSICLLSTASPSYSLWKNFEEKGNQFQFFAKKLGQKKYKV
jgi:UDP-N-acetylmuramoylalanine--D-glutamate ligase